MIPPTNSVLHSSEGCAQCLSMVFQELMAALNSQLSLCAKHSIILTGRHPITECIIRYNHELEGYIGASHMRSVLRRTGLL